MQHDPLDIFIIAIQKCCAPFKPKSYRMGRSKEASAYQNHAITLEQFMTRWRDEIKAHPDREAIVEAMTKRKNELRGEPMTYFSKSRVRLERK
jgi:hypothetical protein